MADSSLKTLTEENFATSVKEGVALIDFYADWCGPCRMLTPVLEKVAVKLKGKAVVAKLDIEASNQIAAKYQVTSVPTLVVFKNGNEEGRIVGLRDEEAIVEFVESKLE